MSVLNLGKTVNRRITMDISKAGFMTAYNNGVEINYIKGMVEMTEEESNSPVPENFDGSKKLVMESYTEEYEEIDENGVSQTKTRNLTRPKLDDDGNEIYTQKNWIEYCGSAYLDNGKYKKRFTKTKNRKFLCPIGSSGDLGQRHDVMYEELRKYVEYFGIDRILLDKDAEKITQSYALGELKNKYPLAVVEPATTETLDSIISDIENSAGMDLDSSNLSDDDKRDLVKRTLMLNEFM